MTLTRGTPPPAPNAGAAPQAPLPFKAPMGSVRVYYIGTKTYKGKDGPKNKTVIHYDNGRGRFAFASNRSDFVADMAELAKIATGADGKVKPITATFQWTKGGPLNVSTA